VAAARSWRKQGKILSVEPGKEWDLGAPGFHTSDLQNCERKAPVALRHQVGGIWLW